MAENRENENYKKLLIAFSNCLLLTFEMEFIRVMEVQRAPSR